MQPFGSSNCEWHLWTLDHFTIYLWSIVIRSMVSLYANNSSLSWRVNFHHKDTILAYDSLSDVPKRPEDAGESTLQHLHFSFFFALSLILLSSRISSFVLSCLIYGKLGVSSFMHDFLILLFFVFFCCLLCSFISSIVGITVAQQGYMTKG